MKAFKCDLCQQLYEPYTASAFLETPGTLRYVKVVFKMDYPDDICPSCQKKGAHKLIRQLEINQRV